MAVLVEKIASAVILRTFPIDPMRKKLHTPAKSGPAAAGTALQRLRQKTHVPFSRSRHIVLRSHPSGKFFRIIAEKLFLFVTF